MPCPRSSASTAIESRCQPRSSEMFDSTQPQNRSKRRPASSVSSRTLDIASWASCHASPPSGGIHTAAPWPPPTSQTIPIGARRSRNHAKAEVSRASTSPPSPSGQRIIGSATNARPNTSASGATRSGPAGVISIGAVVGPSLGPPGHHSPMAAVRLHDIARADDRAAGIGLRLAPGQENYLNSMDEIFEEADRERRAMPHPWAVHDAASGALVGFAMISDNIPQPIDEDLVGPYFLWKLLIDEPC